MSRRFHGHIVDRLPKLPESVDTVLAYDEPEQSNDASNSCWIYNFFIQQHRCIFIARFNLILCLIVYT